MVIFCKKWKKYNEVQLTKNKMDLNIWKMTNHPPSPGYFVKKKKYFPPPQATAPHPNLPGCKNFDIHKRKN